MVYRDKWNPNKTWEVRRTVFGWYIRQYINGYPVSPGLKTNKETVRRMGLFGLQTA